MIYTAVGLAKYGQSKLNKLLVTVMVHRCDVKNTNKRLIKCAHRKSYNN